jgi:anti-sigma factor RsiW
MCLMDCRTAETLLHGYFDGELDLVTSVDIERHLEECSGCAARLAREQALRARLSASALRFSAPAHLRERIAASLNAGVAAKTSAPNRAPRWLPWIAATAAALVALVSLAFVARRPSAEALLARQVRDGHVRSLLAEHLADVASSDQHTVKPWFAGKVSFSPWVGDLSVEGFPLVGGRLDYLDNHSAAALVFKRREHIINLFIWPVDEIRHEPPRLVRENGYQIVHWQKSGTAYWAVSDLNAAELQQFAELVDLRTQGPASGALAD